MSEKETNTQEQEAPVKGKRNFGNTIVLFIVFFIIFTILVTGVAFFADKLKGGSKEAKMTEEQMKQQMTNPETGKEQAYVVDEKGNVAKQEDAPKEEPQPAAAPDEPVLSAPPVEPVKPEEPVKAPEPVKQPEPVKAPAPKETVKPAVKETPKPAVKNTAPKAEAPKSVEKKETVKPAAKSEAPKAAPKKTEAKPAVKVTPVIPGEYHVQLASFKNFELAESEYHRLRSKVSDLQLVKVDLGEKGVWYRLRCGTGLSHESAKARAEQIKALTGYNPDIMK